MKIASRSIDLISKKTNLHVQHTFFSNQQKKKFARAARFFDFLCRCFARLQRLFVRLKHQTLQKSYKIFLWYNCRTGMCLPKILFPVFMFAFIFSLPLIFTLLAASISLFLTAAIKFSCFSSHEIRRLCFQSLALALSLLFT